MLITTFAMSAAAMTTIAPAAGAAIGGIIGGLGGYFAVRGICLRHIKKEETDTCECANTNEEVCQTEGQEATTEGVSA